MLEKACESASSLLRMADPDGTDHRIEIVEFRLDNTVSLYLKYNGDIVYKKVWTAEGPDEVNDIRAVVYGAFLTEVLATFTLTASRTMQHMRKGG
jgi:hypothetical protein